MRASRPVAIAVLAAACAGCATPPPAGEAFTARGHEPSWQLRVDAWRIRFVPGFDGRPIEAAAPWPLPAAGGGRTWVASEQGRPLVVTAIDRPCADSMTGIPHPLTVSVDRDGRRWTGCGGDPASLLVGAEWVVEDLDARGIVDRSRLTLRFSRDGRLAGRASCNDYAARWTLGGEHLTITDVALAGGRGCAAALASQEARFLERLRTVRSVELTPDGALRLSDGVGSILARR